MNLVLQVPLVFQVMLEDLENQEKRDHLALLGHKGVLDYPVQVVYQGFLEKEDCLAFLVCLVLREKWVLQDLLVHKETKEHQEFQE